MARDSSSNVSIATHPDLRPLDAKTAVWAAKHRRISRGTLELLHVAAATIFVPEVKKKCDVIAFLYPGKSWKARAIDEKAFVSKAGHEAAFWGLPEVLARTPDVVYVVEGEMDRCAMVEAGFDPSEVLAAPGASKKKSKDEEEKDEGPDYVGRALDAGLKKVTTFVLCMDNDEVGLPFRKIMAMALGISRCKFVEWPEGCKDANDLLLKNGGDFLAKFIDDNTKDWPVEGLYTIDSFPKSPQLTQWDTQMIGWAPKMYLAPTTLSVVTGQPGHGKSHLWAQLWFNVVKKYGCRIAVATFETTISEYCKWLRNFYVGRMLTPENCIESEIREANDFIRTHYHFIHHPKETPTLDWVMMIGEVAVRKHNVKIFQIDPWNRLEGQRERGESETDYILRCLRNMSMFSKDFGVHFQVLAHPSKGEFQQRSRCPELEDIAGSKHWDNVCDQGFSVWRPRLYDDDGNRITYAELHHKKARFRQLGWQTKFGLNLNLDLDRFEVRGLEQPKKKST